MGSKRCRADTHEDGEGGTVWFKDEEFPDGRWWYGVVGDWYGSIQGIS